MAQKIDQFPESPFLGRYPWDEWLDGSIWKLKQGDDFQAKLHTFRSNAGVQARKRGGTLRSQAVKEDDGQYLVIQFRRDNAS